MSNIFSLDTETTGIDIYHGARPFFVTSCDSSGEVTHWYWKVDPLTRKVQIDKQDLESIRDLIKQADTLVLQNAKFDYAVLRETNKYLLDHWDWDKVEDTLIAGHLLASNKPHNLTDMAAQYLGIDIYPYEDRLHQATEKARRWCRGRYPDWFLAGAGKAGMPSAKGSCWRYDTWLPRVIAETEDRPEDDPFWTVLQEYANTDSAITLALWEEQKKQIEDRDLWAIYRTRMKALPISCKMESRGITVSGKNLFKIQEEYGQESIDLSNKCVAIAESMNYSLKMPKSWINESLNTFLFDCLKIPALKRSDKTGKPSLDKSVMETLLGNDPQLSLPERSKQRLFIQSLADKRKRDAALLYMEGYTRFWLPLIVDEEIIPDWYILHPSLNPTGSDTLRWTSTNPNEQNICCSRDTECLTLSGWKRLDELTEEDKVAQYWPDSKKIEFAIPEEIHRFPFTGNMIHLTTDKQIDMLLTPQHRCLLRNRKTGEHLDIFAKDYRSDYQHLQAGFYIGGDWNPSPDLITLICAVQADGSYHKGNQPGVTNGISFTFKKQRKIRRFKQALNNLKIDYSEKIDKKRKTHAFYLRQKDTTVVYLKELMPKKCLGSWLLNCSRKALDLFAQELFFWDGDYTRQACYSSSCKENADWAQIVWTLTGHRTAVSTRKVITSWSQAEHHFAYVTKNQDYSLTNNFKKEEIPWQDDVFCVTVPSSYFLIRRNGKVSITGNSRKEGFNLRYAFGPAPGREWWSLDAKNIELRIPFYKAGEQSLIDLFERPDDPPYYGSNHLASFHAVYPDIWEQMEKEVGFDKVGPACKKKFASSWYQWCKNGNFAKQYGGQKKKVDSTFRREGAFDLLDKKFSKLAELNRSQIRHANKFGYVETVPDKTVNPYRGYPILCTRTEQGRILETVPLSYYVQGTAMWWTLKAMIRTYEKLEQWNRQCGKDDYRLIMQVHDELVFDFPKSKIDPIEENKRLKEKQEKEGKEGFRRPDCNLWRIRVIQKLMEQGGDDIGVPTPVNIEYHPETWSEGITL